MCGRYALWVRSREVRQSLNDAHMPSQAGPDDEEYRHTYNFAPGYYGLVYRADVPDRGADAIQQDAEEGGSPDANHIEAAKQNSKEAAVDASQDDALREQTYKLQAMKWGLIPFWTKRNPDYGSLMRTINCRDDSLAQGGGMWTSMKKRKRCVVIAQGFYEWQKKNNGKDKIPHFIKRTDGRLICFAGLWDCVQFENSEDKLYTYTIITTDPNPAMKFLHDRMPVILEPGSEEMFRWLDGSRMEWTKDLQDLLKPFEGDLEIYPVSKDVGKVGNDSPSFIVPVDSTENKQNIANFFMGKGHKSVAPSSDKPSQITTEDNETTSSFQGEDTKKPRDDVTPTLKRSLSSAQTETQNPPSKQFKQSPDLPVRPDSAASPTKSDRKPKNTNTRRSRSATSNETRAKAAKSTAADGSKRITAFFGK